MCREMFGIVSTHGVWRSGGHSIRWEAGKILFWLYLGNGKVQEVDPRLGSVGVQHRSVTLI